MLDGVFYGTRAALRHMETQGFGAIVNTASIGAFHPAPDYPFYAAAKAGVVAFTRSVGHEVAGAGIRVNAVAPGSTATAIMAGTDTPARLSSRNACGRIGRPEEIAEAIAFLRVTAPSYCFGEILTGQRRVGVSRNSHVSEHVGGRDGGQQRGLAGAPLLVDRR
jgi:3-oxoacyl-[acyl-carrier protein] reductase